MATARPFAYNTGSPIDGTEQVGDLAVGIPTSGFTYSPRFWEGPDEDLGYVIAVPVPSNTQPTPVSGITASIGFFRTNTFDDNEFISLSEYVSRIEGSPQTFLTAQDASDWLTANGYWNSYVNSGNALILNWDIQNIGSYSGVGTTIIDLVGNSNGTLYNNPTYSEAVTKYIYTNYPSDSSYIMTDTSLNSVLNPNNGGNEISVFMWVYPLSNDGILLSEQGSPNPPDGGWFDTQIQMSDGDILFDVWPYTGGAITSSSSPQVNDWNYVGFTYKLGSPDTLTCYVNGQSTGSKTITREAPNNYGEDLYYALTYPCATNLAGSSTGGDFRLGGMKVWNYGLSGTEVLTDYNSNKLNYTRGLLMDLNATNSSSYPGLGGGTWYDLTGWGNNGTPFGASFSGISGGTFVFNGTSNFVSLGNQILGTYSDYSINAWVYANDLVGARNILSTQSSPFWCSNATLYAGVGGNYTEVGYGPLLTNTWYFVSMTFNDTTNTMKLYVNGILVDTNTSVSGSYSQENMYIGSHFNVTNVSFWSGYIPQVYLYNNEQSSDEILHLFNQTKSLYGL